MDLRQGDELRAYVAHWQRAGRALEAVERRELEEFNPEEHVAELDALMDMGAQLSRPETTSGLLEQQRWFMKARRR